MGGGGETAVREPQTTTGSVTGKGTYQPDGAIVFRGTVWPTQKRPRAMPAGAP